MAPKDAATRPTSEKVREAVFSILGAVAGQAVLDLYAGTGALGLEALSRGARRVVFVESRRAAADALRANVNALGVGGEVVIVQRPVERAATALVPQAPFELVFVDAPYADVADGRVTKALDTLLQPLLAPGATLVLEHGVKTEPPRLANCTLVDTRSYGDTGVSFYTGAPGV